MIVDTVLVKVASRCNLDCSYCYVYNMGDDGWRRQPKRFAPETIKALGKSLAELAEVQGRGFAVVFHGGEPLLLGRERLAFLCGTLRTALPEDCTLAIQTNGVLLDEAMIAVCLEHDVSISISLDGPEEVHDRARPDLRGRGTYRRVMASISRLQASPEHQRLLTGVLAVIDPDADPIATYEALKATGAPSIDFLHRDGNNDVLPFGKAALDTVEYGTWLVRLLDHYLADTRPTPIRLFDEMLKLLLTERLPGAPSPAQNGAMLVIETDGTVQKNDTLKSAYQGADRFEATTSVFAGGLAAFVRSLAFEEHEAAQRPTASACLVCPDLSACGGGMPAHRWSQRAGYANPSVYCVDQQLLIRHMRSRIAAWRAAA